MQQELIVDDARPVEVTPRPEHREQPPTTVATVRQQPRVSVVIAALNEEQSIQHVLPRIPGDVFEVVLVDGDSTDRTVEEARRLRPDIRVVYQNRRGKGNALRCGFAVARGDIIVSLDADGSTDPAEIPAFVGALLGGADYAKGSRFIPGAGTADMTATRRLGNLGFLVLVRVLFHKRYTDLCYGYFAFWRRVLPTLQLRSDGFEIETEINVRAAVTGLKVVEVASFEGERVAGEAHLRPIPDGWRVLKEIVKQQRRAAAARASTSRLRRLVVEDSGGMESPR